MAKRIDIHPDICNGRPVIAGTRIPVQIIMEFLGAGDSIDEVLEAYPSLKREDVYACIQFAAKLTVALQSNKWNHCVVNR